MPNGCLNTNDSQVPGNSCFCSCTSIKKAKVSKLEAGSQQDFLFYYNPDSEARSEGAQRTAR